MVRASEYFHEKSAKNTIRLISPPSKKHSQTRLISFFILFFPSSRVQQIPTRSDIDSMERCSVIDAMSEVFVLSVLFALYVYVVHSVTDLFVDCALPHSPSVR